ncbi:Rus Holliday junction resolvase [uncultured Caudovirales phage]|uniref:Rus Holliday junction resolvase n=1 Tax=uncultured Caudovirales phage TaxID=2100421 RepID=A0A6J5LLI9_9CAUD|nr:Rus Holliday junction resolvase [uncultured Caudovirales phage]
MILIQIDGPPVPWAAARITHRGSFSPRYKEKEMARWQIKSWYNRLDVIQGAVSLTFVFHMPIPVKTSKMKRLQMLSGVIKHTCGPDVTNMVKHAEDCLKGIVIADESQVYKINAEKIYSETAKTVIQIVVLP